MNKKASRLQSCLGGCIAALLLIASPLGVAPLRADPPITAGQLSLSVQQSGVPQAPVTKSKDKDKDKTPQGTTVMRAVTINLRRVGAADGHVTLKTTFIGLDVETKQKVVNSERTKEAEAVPGAGNTYTETSEPFTTYPRSVDPKTGTVTPAHGTKPAGWVVRVYQGDKLLTTSGSTPDMVSWIASH